jgi:hypothetical protein
VLGADRVAKFILGYAGKTDWSRSTARRVSSCGIRFPETARTRSRSRTAVFRAIDVVRNPDKLRGFHPRMR